MGMVSILPKGPRRLAVREVADRQGGSRMLPAFTLPEDDARHLGNGGGSFPCCPKRDARPDYRARSARRFSGSCRVEFACQEVPGAAHPVRSRRDGCWINP
jgi:hypothetical protein